MYYGDNPKGLRARWPVQQVGAFCVDLRDSLLEKAGFLTMLRASPPTFLLARSSLSLATFSRFEVDSMLSGAMFRPIFGPGSPRVLTKFFWIRRVVHRVLTRVRQPKRDLHKHFGWCCVGRASHHQQRFKTRHIRGETSRVPTLVP